MQHPIYSELVLFNQIRIKERVLQFTAFLEPKEVEETKEEAQ